VEHPWPLRIRITTVVSPVIGAVLIFLAVPNFESGPKTAPSGGSTVPGLIASLLVRSSLLVVGVVRVAYMLRAKIEPL